MNKLKKFKELSPLDLRSVKTVSELVEAMSFCSFGARMLGETAESLTRWIKNRPPIAVCDYPLDDPVFRLIQKMKFDGWFSDILKPDELSTRTAAGYLNNQVVIGSFSERQRELILKVPGRKIFINNDNFSQPGQITDGCFKDVVLEDPRLVLPILRAVLLERIDDEKKSITDLLEDLAGFGGVAEEVVVGAKTFMAMVTDKDCFVFLTLSGAMTIAKMGLLVCDLIESGMVHAISSTGALMAHGLVEGIGLKHYKYDPRFRDEDLAALKLNRVTDTLEPESNFDRIEQLIDEVMDSFTAGKIISPSELHIKIGEKLAADFPNQRGILKSAFQKKVPVFVPAFVDSEIGNDVYVHNLKRAARGEKAVMVNMELDTKKMINLISSAKRLGILTIGGGVPRNNTQNLAPLIEIINERLHSNLPPCRFSYGCRICPDRLNLGHLSGCTYSEGKSWRKMEARGDFSEVHADATIVWPLIQKYVMENCLGPDGVAFPLTCHTAGTRTVLRNMFA
jgi:deoxyhypusine synthase